jgi:hypothetical protein
MAHHSKAGMIGAVSICRDMLMEGWHLANNNSNMGGIKLANARAIVNADTHPPVVAYILLCVFMMDALQSFPQHGFFNIIGSVQLLP